MSEPSFLVNETAHNTFAMRSSHSAKQLVRSLITS